MDFYNNSQPLDLPPAVRGDPFSSRNGIRLTQFFEDGSAEGELTVVPEVLNLHGYVHGGCLATLADTVGGWAVIMAQKKACVTVNYAFNFLRPAKGTYSKIICRATPEKLGRTLCVYRLLLTSDTGVEVANGNFTFFLTDPPTSGAGQCKPLPLT